MEFETGQEYFNVYFMSVDAKGHSAIVRSNDADKVDQAFDGFEKVVYDAVDEAQHDSRCQYAQFWGWAGDGGLCIFRDDEESSARRTALKAAKLILEELPGLNGRLTRQDVRGELAVRIAIHKGAFRYKGDEKRGSIHSRELNFCVHLEKVVPMNCVAISSAIHELTPEGDEFFQAALPFEDHEVFLHGDRPAEDIQAEWRERVAPRHGTALPLQSDVPLSEFGLVGVYSQRAVTGTFRAYFERCSDRLWVMGIGLGGFRSDHDQPVRDLVERGVDVRLLALEANTRHASVAAYENSFDLVSWCDQESGSGNNAASASDLQTWCERMNRELQTSDASGRLKLRYYAAVPSAAVLIADSAVFVSPFVGTNNNIKLPMFEYVAARRLGKLWIDRFTRIWEDDRLSRAATGELDRA